MQNEKKFNSKAMRWPVPNVPLIIYKNGLLLNIRKKQVKCKSGYVLNINITLSSI